MQPTDQIAELEKRVTERTAQLEAANKELEAFSYAVSHDLRAPLRAISGFTRILQEDAAPVLNQECKETLERIIDSSAQMHRLIEDLMTLSRETAREPNKESVDLSAMAQHIFDDLRQSAPERKVEFVCQSEMTAHADVGLMQIVLNNLIANAWKFTGLKPRAIIEFKCGKNPEGKTIFSIRDNGAGFDMAFGNRLFQPFQRLHRNDEFPGTGIGLATVQRIVRKHGGRIWAEAKPGNGATFFFTLS